MLSALDGKPEDPVYIEVNCVYSLSMIVVKLVLILFMFQTALYIMAQNDNL